MPMGCNQSHVLHPPNNRKKVLYFGIFLRKSALVELVAVCSNKRCNHVMKQNDTVYESRISGLNVSIFIILIHLVLSKIYNL